jgi:two-component system KDP operon response regulator KdpE
MIAAASGHHSNVHDETVTVLIIEDEPQIRRLVRNALHAHPTFLRLGLSDEQHTPELRVIDATNGEEGIDMTVAEVPALIILDLGLPDMEGLSVCREIRRWSSAPLIVLSARHADTEKVALLDAGADDYVTKPFSSVEFMARVRAQMRRRAAAVRQNGIADVLSFGDVVVDQQRRRVERKGAPVHLTPTEWALLRTLVNHPRQTLTHQQLFHQVWGNAVGDAQQYLRVYVGHLRRKIEADPVRPRFIHTESGVGYRFEPEDDVA